MNKKEQRKRKVVQHTIYNSYPQEAFRKRLGLDVGDFNNYGYKKLLEERKNKEELKLELKIDVLNENLKDLLEKVKEVREEIAESQFLLKELQRITPEIKENVFSEMEILFSEFEEESKVHYEKHPENIPNKIEGFYSARAGSISSIGRKYKLTEEEVKEIYEEELQYREILAEFEEVASKHKSNK